MRYYAKLTSAQSGTKVFKFGYMIDAGGSIAWKSDAIKSMSGFRDKMTMVMGNDSVNKFNSLCIWIEISYEKGIGPMFNQVKNTFSDILISAQEDNVSTNKSPTARFRRPTLNFALPVTPPDGSSAGLKCQLLNFTFEEFSLDPS